MERLTQCLEVEVEAFYDLRAGNDRTGCPRELVGVGEEGYHPSEV